MNDPVAIVGLAGRFPGSGADLDRFWENVAQARDCSRDVPPGRWVLPPDRCLDLRVPHPDSVYSLRGYFLDPFDPDLTGLAVPADLAAQLDPLFHLVLDVGNRAWRSAKTAGLDRRRVGVVLGNICLPTDKANDLCREVLGDAPGVKTHPLNRYVAGLPAGLLAKGLGLGGGTFTLDAACASTLYAIKLAADELLAGRADAMLAGGCNRADSQYTQMGFAQLRALSVSGRCSPFDAAADGLMVGEGAGVFVLKRLADARRDRDTVHAVLCGWGLSNDMGANLLSPAVEGQLRAMRAAYRRAGWQPTDVELVECHATGTPVGDAVEFDSLSELWQGLSWKPGRCVIGSVKSTVGHLLTGAGAAAVVKVVKAFAAGRLPPQANFDSPGPALRYQDGPFRVLPFADEWRPRKETGAPRRAAVSGFGFGGVNAHLLFEQYVGQRYGPPRPTPPKSGTVTAAREPEPIAVVGLAARFGPWEDLRAFQEYVLGGGVPHDPAPKRNGWGSAAGPCPPGHYVEELRVPLDRFRIPPKELEEMLPQQVLMLQAAAAALDDAGGEVGEADPATGVFVGLGLDLNTTNYHLRWAALAQRSEVRGQRSEDEAQISGLCPLTANRVMGALGSIAASRIARAFHFGGPSFTACSEESSGGRAVELAVRALRAGEIDRALVGGVDFPGDPRVVHTMPPGTTPGEGAAAVVLKRLADAERDGDRVYAVVRGVGCASGGPAGGTAPDAAAVASSLLRACGDGPTDPATIGYLDAAGGRPEAEAVAALLGAAGRPHPLAIGSAAEQVGHAGFAAGLAGLVKACLALYQQILPPSAGEPRPELAVVTDRCHFPSRPQFWLTNADSPRRAAVGCAGADGSSIHVVLEECAKNARDVERAQPLGARDEAVFAVEADTPADLLAGLGRLAVWAADDDRPVEALARAWFRHAPPDPRRKLAAALVARSAEELREQAAFAAECVRAGAAPVPDPRPSLRDRVFYAPAPVGRGGKLAFVFPGSGNHFPGMGRDLGAAWPAVLRRQQGENRRLRDQYQPEVFWADVIPPDATPRDALFGQVAVGTLVADLLAALGVAPDAMIGLSLGESAGLFALRAWTSRDEMDRRTRETSLFNSDLGPPYDAARRFYGLSADAAVDWVTGVLAAPAADAARHLRRGSRAYVQIVTTPTECVVGGLRKDVEELVAAVGQPFFPLSGVTLAHCEAGLPVEGPYRELHRLPAKHPPGVVVYSGAWGRPYPVTEATAAESITSGLVSRIDFPAVVEAAYRDGVRAFVEIGPGNSCARMIDAILGDRPHFARAAHAPRQDAASQVLRLVANLIAERVPVSLTGLYGGESACADHRPPVPEGKRELIIPVGLPPQMEPAPVVVRKRPVVAESIAAADRRPVTVPDYGPFATAAAVTQRSAADAHALFLRVQDGLTRTAVAALQLQTALIRRMASVGDSLRESPSPERLPFPNGPFPDPPMVTRGASDLRSPPRSLTTEQCFAFARGKVGDVLGPLYAEVDSFPTRVRLPDGPLMLVDHVLKIEGEPKSLTSGRVVTDHTVRPDRWYLEAGRCPTCVAVEAGQADLFLSGFLGIDFRTRGEAVYRLLDAVVTFHRGLPAVGERIEYDIRIDEFTRQADAWLFRFRFEGTVNGEPLLSMQNGVAGFFTRAALEAGQGIVHTKLDTQPIPGKRPADWRDFVPPASGSLTADQVDALRKGYLVAAFGPEFLRATVPFPQPLPGGMMQLVDRVPVVDPAGGRFGLGFVRAEYDIRPKEWFIECHFVDDKVMPGTLMYECCLHTLRILLMRMGWVGTAGEVVCEPVPGVHSRLKCRGQVLETTRTVTYEVSVKELGYRPEPFAVADALMYADGKPIVEITNMSLRMTGLTRAKLEAVWADGPKSKMFGPDTPQYDMRPAVYDHDRILAFSNGNPSEAFGEPYKVFDADRVIARLPGPPFQFLDRITAVAGEPFAMTAGATCDAQYDVPPAAWYFAANRCPRMPFSVLLEIALQPCGWLAAYCGSALTSPTDLKFRNLGGKATLYEPIGPDAGTLTTTATMTKVAASGGMIIQHYDFCVRRAGRPVYEGDTYFGFFSQEALTNQVGMPAAKVPFLTDDQVAFADKGGLPAGPPFPEPMLRMIDAIDGYLPRGGAKGLGLVQGRIAVDPTFWFFAAHFYQDPVWPGSLGLESFLQLLKYVAWKKWGDPPAGGWQTTAADRPHAWVYRGQVVPTDRAVTVVLEITEADPAARRLTADGFLVVDGRVIYQMSGFTLE